MILQFRRLPMFLALPAVALLLHHGRADDKPVPKPAPPVAKAGIPDRLAKRVIVEKFDGKLKDLFKLLRDQYDLPLTIDPSLSLEDGGELAEKPVALPRRTDVRVDTVLRLVCDQIGAMFLTGPDDIRIVSLMHGMIEAGVAKYGSSDENESPLPLIERPKYQPAIKSTLVNAVFKDKPVAVILDAIAEATSANIMLAPRATELGKQPLTVRFANTPVEVAVRTICELADLGVIEDTTVLLVTTRDRAAEHVAARVKAEEAKLKTRQLMANPYIGGTGIPPPHINIAVEFEKLKEQNEQLKKQLDEIQKQLKK